MISLDELPLKQDKELQDVYIGWKPPIPNLIDDKQVGLEDACPCIKEYIEVGSLYILLYELSLFMRKTQFQSFFQRKCVLFSEIFV